MRTIAVVGTGIMGAGIASNFLKHGYRVVVWNRTKEKLDPLRGAGAVEAITPKAAAEAADIVFEMTANDVSSREAWLGEEGILSGSSSDKILIASGTFSAAWIDELAKACASRGCAFFDMPVTGGRKGAETGTLIFLVGGDERKLEEVKPDLQAVSQSVLYLGKSGSGCRYKLLLNMLQGIHIAALGEVLRVAQAIGMDVEKVGNALAERPGGTTTALAWQGYQKTPDPINFSVAWIKKDLSYAKELAGGFPTPVLDEVLQKYKEAIQEGKDQEDWTVITKR